LCTYTSITVRTWIQVFNMLDADGDGKLTPEELTHDFDGFLLSECVREGESADGRASERARVRETRTDTHTHKHTHTHTYTHRRRHTRTDTYSHAQTYTHLHQMCARSFDCLLSLIMKHVPPSSRPPLAQTKTHTHSHSLTHSLTLSHTHTLQQRESTRSVLRRRSSMRSGAWGWSMYCTLVFVD
jgi:hypothetical protein